MRRHALPLVLALAAALPSLAAAQASAQPPAGSAAPTGLTLGLSLAGGAELALEEGAGKAGLAELEGAVGYELEGIGVRPELAVALGLAPGTDIAFRPGVRVALPGAPVQLRAALDASTARVSGVRFRWLLLGVATELRFTSVLALFGEIDSGVPLNSVAGLPLLFRAGATFRF